MEIHLKWKSMTRSNRGLSRVLYSYVNSHDKQILYVGKADFCSVGQRMNGEHKQGLFEYFDEINVRKFKVIIGEFYMDEGQRLTQELISDVESLLIKRLQPPGNIMSKISRISRPGLKVLCFGNWPSKRNGFYDR